MPKLHVEPKPGDYVRVISRHDHHPPAIGKVLSVEVRRSGVLLPKEDKEKDIGTEHAEDVFLVINVPGDRGGASEVRVLAEDCEIIDVGLTEEEQKAKDVFQGKADPPKPAKRGGKTDPPELDPNAGAAH